MPIVSINNKGPAPDSSMRTDILRRRAIINGQSSKNPAFDQTIKPFIGQYHLTDGFTNGIVQFRFTRGLNSITRF
jgi:hypothetical protein